MKIEDLPAAVNIYGTVMVGGGPKNPGADIDLSKIVVDPRVPMVLVAYHSPFQVSGLLCSGPLSFFVQDDPRPIERWYFVGYRCGKCQKVFLVPDSVADFDNLYAFLRHGCMENL